MADLYFRVYETAGATAQGQKVQEGKVAIGGTSTQSAAISNGARPSNAAMKVRLWTDGACFVTWGENPTALNDGTEGMPMAADSYEYVQIQAGHLLAVIEKV